MTTQDGKEVELVIDHASAGGGIAPDPVMHKDEDGCFGANTLEITREPVQLRLVEMAPVLQHDGRVEQHEVRAGVVEGLVELAELLHKAFLAQRVPADVMAAWDRIELDARVLQRGESRFEFGELFGATRIGEIACGDHKIVSRRHRGRLFRPLAQRFGSALRRLLDVGDVQKAKSVQRG